MSPVQGTNCDFSVQEFFRVYMTHEDANVKHRGANVKHRGTTECSVAQRDVDLDLRKYGYGLVLLKRSALEKVAIKAKVDAFSNKLSQGNS